VYKKCPTRPNETYMFLNYLGDENLLFQKDPVVVKQLRLKYNRMVSNQDALRKVTRVAQEMFEKRDWLDKKGVDIHSMTGPLIYDIMGRVLFGGEWSKSEIGKEIRKNHVYLIENSNVWAFYPFKPWYSSAYRKYASTIKILRHKAGILVDQRKRDIENDKTGKEAQRKDAVTMLCTERREDGTLFFSRALAISTLIGFLNGAYDTTHATTDWLLYHLAKYPDVQKRVQEEIDTKVKGDRVTLEEARSLTYLRAVISESMRLRSTVPVNQRVNLREDVAFGDGGKYVVPKGVNVNIPMALTFRCPAHFPGPKDASEFCPERFLGKSDSATKCSRSHTAFGAQKRMCVGFTFALAELLAITVFMMKRFNVFCVDDNEKGPMKIEAGVNQPDGVLRLRFTRRR